MRNVKGKGAKVKNMEIETVKTQPNYQDEEPVKNKSRPPEEEIAMNKLNFKENLQEEESGDQDVKNHTAFNELIWSIDPYFAQNIQKLNPFRYECKSCKDHSVPKKWREFGRAFEEQDSPSIFWSIEKSNETICYQISRV